MSKALNDIVETLSTIREPAGLEEVIEAVRDAYQVDHLCYHALSLGLDAVSAEEDRGGAWRRLSGFWRQEGRSLGAMSYSSDWIARYLEKRYDTIDPVVAGALGGFAAIDWGELDWSEASHKRFLHEAIEFGIGNHGFTVPIRGPNGQFAMFTVNKTCAPSEWSSWMEAHRHDMTLVAHYVHQQALTFATPSSTILAGTPLRALSARERDAINLIAEGLSRGQAADKLGISENTFRVYIDSARHKLGALNIPHAVALAAYRGVISPQ